MVYLTNRMFFLALAALIFQTSCTAEKGEPEGPEPKVYIKKHDDGYTLIRNGSPFTIKGACAIEFFSELRAAGANTVRVYDTVDLKSTLDRAHKNDLAVVVDIPLPRFAEPDTIFSNKESMAQLFRRTKKFVSAYKDHPALLYWMLGNEIAYPDLPGDGHLTENFNALIDMIREEDGDHPISTAVSGFNRSGILAIKTLSSGIDFISINIFGELGSFAWRKDLFSPLWSGPYVFSEFGINGPWEADETRWQAPIEQTSTKKAEQFRERYDQYIKTIDDGRLLGSLFFYWGNKQERTHTWFSTVMDDGRKSQLAFEYEKIWQGTAMEFEGPRVDYALLNGRGAPASSVLPPGTKASAELVVPKGSRGAEQSTRWNIRPEGWNYLFNQNEERPKVIHSLTLSATDSTLMFITPKKEGPYRLFVTIDGGGNYSAGTNIPFYILNPENGQ